MPVVLFDIDGTLILTGRAGQFAMQRVAAKEPVPKLAAADPMRKPIRETEIPSEMSFAGRTDRSIIADYFQRMGIEPTADCWGAFAAKFLRELPQELKRRNGFVLPGVFGILEQLRQIPDVHLGLLTGNLREAAWLKLSHYGLAEYFYRERQAMGGFGDDHLDRDDVAREALRDVHCKIDTSIHPSNVWVIGDTPKDVQCARAIGARVIAVATGEFSVETLAESEPDLLVRDLTQADSWCKTLERLA
jgi:phosphoglycolate phosphatase